MTYSTEQQTQIIKMKSEGKSSREIAKSLGLSKSGVNDFLARVTKETEYLMQGENGKRLSESIKQLNTFSEKQKGLLAQVTDIKLEGGSPLIRYVNTLGTFGNEEPEINNPLSEQQKIVIANNCGIKLKEGQKVDLNLPPEYMSPDASEAQKAVYKASVEFMETNWGDGVSQYCKERDEMYERADKALLSYYGNDEPECIVPFTRNEEGELKLSIPPSTKLPCKIKFKDNSALDDMLYHANSTKPSDELGRLGEACSGQELPLSYTLYKLGDKGFSDALEHLGNNGLGNLTTKIVNHVDDCRKVKVERREEPLMKIVTSPLRVGGKTHMYIGDSQVKPNVSFEYLRCKGEYIVEKKPDVVVFGGDFADMPSLSSYDKGKGKAEGKRVKKDIEAAIKGMQTLLKPLYDFQQKQLREFGFIGYKPRMLITLGNHEDRITRYTNDNPELIDFISIDSLKYEEQGLEVYPFLEPVLVDGITYIHYLPNEFTGKAQGGNASKVLADFGGSITQGHKQILTVATRFAPATGQQTWFLQAGACYDHNEEYKGLYNNNHFRGLIMKYNLDGKGNYDLHTVSLKYIMDKYSWI